MPLLLVLLACLLFAAPATAAPVPEGAEWHEEYFPSGDGTVLHADVLRPKGLPADARTPVLLTVSPYTNHAAQQGIDYDPSAQGPSGRFLKDFAIPAKIFERGYTYVIVDLRGNGGSAGCNDWGGPGERMDARAAVEWAASQPWSTGKVGIFGKSYDGWTGLMAAAERPKGLAAVLSMEPVYSGYRYLYTNGVRFVNSVATPASFTLIDLAPGSLQDDPQYLVNGTPQGCYALNIGQQQQNSEAAPFWEERNLLPPLKGVTTPVFLTQGFIERNTKPDGAFDVFRDLAGPKRAWFGQFDHWRGWEKEADGESYKVGRGGFLEEAIAFLDHHVRGDGPAPAGPAVAVQDDQGRYRGEDAWPPADAVARRSALNDGTYSDDGANEGRGDAGGQGLWTVSAPLAHRARLAGEPVFRGTLAAAAPSANLVVNLYDVGPDGKAVLVSRGATLLRTNEVELKMYGQDWVFEPGHRVGVLVSGANSEWWVHAPTNATVDVQGSSIELPFLTYERTGDLGGVATADIEAWKASTVTAPDGGEVTFDLPPALAPRPGGPSSPATPAKRRKLTAKAQRAKGRLVVRGRAPRGAYVSVTALRGKRVLKTAVSRAKRGRYVIRLRAARATKVVVRAAGQRVTTRTRAR
jgi:predicted acyl esterase